MYQVLYIKKCLYRERGSIGDDQVSRVFFFIDRIPGMHLLQELSQLLRSSIQRWAHDNEMLAGIPLVLYPNSLFHYVHITSPCNRLMCFVLLWIYTMMT